MSSGASGERSWGSGGGVVSIRRAATRRLRRSAVLSALFFSASRLETRDGPPYFERVGLRAGCCTSRDAHSPSPRAIGDARVIARRLVARRGVRRQAGVWISQARSGARSPAADRTLTPQDPADCTHYRPPASASHHTPSDVRWRPHGYTIPVATGVAYLRPEPRQPRTAKRPWWTMSLCVPAASNILTIHHVTPPGACPPTCAVTPRGGDT
jgi:hypothetical protein